MLEDFRLKVFLAVVKEKSFTRAATLLGISQPAVSQNIAEIEKGMGRKFFDRLRGETVLTKEGEVFLEYAENLLKMQEHTEMMFSGIQKTVVRISASEELYEFLIRPAVERFSAIHPEVTFERAMFGDADLKLSLVPSTGSQFDLNANSIARIRMSLAPAPKMGDLPATHEKTSYFDLLFQPSQTFSCTKACRLLKDFLI